MRIAVLRDAHRKAFDDLTRSADLLRLAGGQLPPSGPE